MKSCMKCPEIKAFQARKEGNTRFVPSFLIFNTLMSIFIRNFAQILFE